jgi:hypothetical protein
LAFGEIEGTVVDNAAGHFHRRAHQDIDVPAQLLKLPKSLISRGEGDVIDDVHQMVAAEREFREDNQVHFIFDGAVDLFDMELDVFGEISQGGTELKASYFHGHTIPYQRSLFKLPGFGCPVV